MKIQIELQKEDWLLYQTHIEKKLQKQHNPQASNHRANIIIWAVIGAVSMVAFQKFSEFHWPTAAMLTLIFGVLYVQSIRGTAKIRKAFEPLESGTFCGSHEFTFTSQGITCEGKGYKSNYSWEVVKQVERTSEMILIYLDSTVSYVFLLSKLDNPDEFYRYISEQYPNVTANSSLNQLPEPND